MTIPRVLVLPGWQGGSPAHWQMRWVANHGYSVVDQHDWQRPLRGDWLMRLEEAVHEAPGEVVLVAHNLGCNLVAAWAAHSPRRARHALRVRAALLVAPVDVHTLVLGHALASWSEETSQRLPFKAMVVGSENDPLCSLSTAQTLAVNWGARWLSLGLAGPIDAESKLGDWPQGLALLTELMKD